MLFNDTKAEKSDGCRVSIIIPTLASISRKLQLLRAVDSVLVDAVGSARCIICVNGNQWDSSTIDALQRRGGVELHRLPEPSLPKAIAFGRSVVRTDFFGFLDDDDELLPGAIDQRLKIHLSKPDCDLVVSNGIRRTAFGDQTLLTQLELVPADPLTSLFRENWLPSCGGLFRTATIAQGYFEDYHEYAEWTWLAYRLALDGKRVETLNRPTFVVNDTPGSLSKSVAYDNAYIALYRRMLNCHPNIPIRKVILRRMANALHDQSSASLKRGEVFDAARKHLQSMLLPGGLRFFSYTRHIARQALTGSLRRAQ
jgi:glycosyltransferase involved in cell wall biosynthesis